MVPVSPAKQEHLFRNRAFIFRRYRMWTVPLHGCPTRYASFFLLNRRGDIRGFTRWIRLTAIGLDGRFMHSDLGAETCHTTPYDFLIVGAGFAGAVLAERLAVDGGYRVLVVDRRPHIAGNAYDVPDAAGVLIHQYGPHIFHTNSDQVLAYLSRFTDWRPYEHRVLAHWNGQLLPVPINRTTINKFFGLDLATDDAAEAFLNQQAEIVPQIRTSEDVVVGRVGRPLYEAFFRGYTRKQWGVDPSELDKSVTARVPVRTNTDDRYFNDRHQLMPKHGYTAMFERLLDHPDITVRTGTEYRDVMAHVRARHVIFTGPIDEFFDYRFGRLPYRSLRFDHRHVEAPSSSPWPSSTIPARTCPTPASRNTST